MPPTKQDTKKESWLWRKIRVWRAFVMDVRHWGPLAIREIVDDWSLAIRPDRKAQSVNHAADQELQNKLNEVARSAEEKGGQSPFVLSTLRAVPANGDSPPFSGRPPGITQLHLDRDTTGNVS